MCITFDENEITDLKQKIISEKHPSILFPIKIEKQFQIKQNTIF